VRIKKRKAKKEPENLREIDGVRIVDIKGVFNKDTTPRICSMIGSSVDNREIDGVLLDFKGVTELDTTAFACMVDVIKKYIKGKSRIGILNLPKQGEALLDILKIDRLITLYKSEKRAIKCLKKKK